MSKKCPERSQSHQSGQNKRQHARSRKHTNKGTPAVSETRCSGTGNSRHSKPMCAQEGSGCPLFSMSHERHRVHRLARIDRVSGLPLTLRIPQRKVVRRVVALRAVDACAPRQHTHHIRFVTSVMRRHSAYWRSYIRQRLRPPGFIFSVV